MAIEAEFPVEKAQGAEKRRIGLLGGTFDPIHNGHLVMAEEVRVRLGLERVLLIPARISPLKLERGVTAVEQRLHMIDLAIAGNPAFELCLVDLERPGPSYTVDTLRLLAQQLGPEVEFYFILGQDALATLLQWRSPGEIIRLARLVVVNRPGYHTDIAALESALPGLHESLIHLETPELSVASSDLRRRVRQGWPIRYQVPEAVWAYIEEQQLYREDGQEEPLKASCNAHHVGAGQGHPRE